MTDDWCWFSFVVGIVGITIAMIVAVTTYNMNANERIVEMVKIGANPVSASCAINERIHVCMAAGILENGE